MNDNEFLTSNEVVEMIGDNIDLDYLYYLRRSGQLMPINQKTIKLKPRLLYRRTDVEKFIAKREQDKESHPRSKIVA